MRYHIEEKILATYPDTILGLVVVRGINNQGNDTQLNELLQEQHTIIRKNYAVETLSADPPNCFLASCL